MLSTISICFQNKRSLLRDILLTQHLLGGLATLTLSYVNCVKNISRLAGQGNCQCFLLTSHVETCTELYCKLQQSENLNNSTAICPTFHSVKGNRLNEFTNFLCLTKEKTSSQHFCRCELNEWILKHHFIAH